MAKISRIKSSEHVDPDVKLLGSDPDNIESTLNYPIREVAKTVGELIKDDLEPIVSNLILDNKDFSEYVKDQFVVDSLLGRLRGEYIPNEVYNKLDQVSYNGSSYVSKIDNNANPLSNVDFWQVIAKKGDSVISTKLDESEKEYFAREIPALGSISPNDKNSISGSKAFKELISKVDSIIELRSIEGKEEGQIITLLGYYEAGDKEPLNYKFTSTQGVDDGASVINSSNGSWEVIISNYVYVSIYGEGNNILKALSIRDEVVIDKTIDLNGLSVVVPANKIITFSVDCKIINGSITFNNTLINNARFENVVFSGDIKNTEIIYSGFNDLSIFVTTGNTNTKILIDNNITSPIYRTIEVKNFNVKGIGATYPKWSNIGVQVTEDIDVSNIYLDYTVDVSLSGYFLSLKYGKDYRTVKINNVNKLAITSRNLAYFIRESLIATGDKTGTIIDYLEVLNCEVNNLTNSFIRLPIDILSGIVAFNKVNEIGSQISTRAVGMQLGYLGGISKDLEIKLNRVTNLRTVYGATNDGTFCNGIIVYGDDSVIHKNYIQNLWGWKDGAYSLKSGMDHEGIYLKGSNVNITNNTVIDACGEESDASITIKAYGTNNKIEGNNIVVNTGGRAIYAMYERQLDVVNNNVVIPILANIGQPALLHFAKEQDTNHDDSLLNIDNINLRVTSDVNISGYAMLFYRCSGVVNIRNLNSFFAKGLQFIRVLKEADQPLTNLEINIIDSHNIHVSGALKPIISNINGSLYNKADFNIINSDLFFYDVEFPISLIKNSFKSNNSSIVQVSGSSPVGLFRFTSDKGVRFYNTKIKVASTNASTYLMRLDRNDSTAAGNTEIEDCTILTDSPSSIRVLYNSGSVVTDKLKFINNTHNYISLSIITNSYIYNEVNIYDNKSLLTTFRINDGNTNILSSNIIEFNNLKYKETPLLNKASFISNVTTANAEDLASALVLVNELKEKNNDLLSKLKLAGIMNTI